MCSDMKFNIQTTLCSKLLSELSLSSVHLTYCKTTCRMNVNVEPPSL